MEVSEVKQIIKKELKDYLTKKEAEKMIGKLLTKDDVRKLIRRAIINQYKVLWEKSSLYINKI